MEAPEIVNAWRIDSWLQDATAGLCDAAKERIGQEIRAHYHDAVATHEAEGRDLKTAQQLAVEELGDAKAAAMRFRTKHLTAKEDDFVKREMVLVNTFKPWLTVGLGCLTVAFLLMLFFAFPSRDNFSRNLFRILMVLTGLFIAEILVLAYSRKSTRSLSYNDAVKNISLLMSVRTACYPLAILIVLFWVSGLLSLVFLWNVGRELAGFRWIPIYFKLKNDRKVVV